MCRVKSFKRAVSTLFEFVYKDVVSLYGELEFNIDCSAIDLETEGLIHRLASGDMVEEREVMDILWSYAELFYSAFDLDRKNLVWQKILELTANIFNESFRILHIYSKGAHIYSVKKYNDNPIISVYGPEGLIICVWNVQNVSYSGGTLLAQLDPLTYLFVGNSVYEFSTLDSEFVCFQGGDQSVLYHKKCAYLLSRFYCMSNSTPIDIYHYVERLRRGNIFDVKLYNREIVHEIPLRMLEEEIHHSTVFNQEIVKYKTVIDSDGEEEIVEYKTVIDSDGEEEIVKYKTVIDSDGEEEIILEGKK